MTDRVQQAKRRALAALGSWDRARAAVNDPDAVPARLDEIVRVTRQTIATVSQDVVIEVDALLVELGTIAFADTDNEELGKLEETTRALQGVLDTVRRTAAQAGFADTEEELGVPPGLRVPIDRLSEQLAQFTDALRAVRPALETIAGGSAADPGASPIETALIRNEIAVVNVKVDLALVKTGKVSLVDVSGLASIGRSLQRSLDRFTATVQSTAFALSDWIRTQTPRILGPLADGLRTATAALTRRVADWISAMRPPQPPSAAEREQLPDGWSKQRIIGRLIGGEPLPDAVLASLRELSPHGYPIARLEHLAGAVRLRSLSLDRTRVTDLSELGGLTNLISLSLDGTEVTDLSPLASLTSLTSLSLDHTRVADLSALAALTGLTSLSLDHTPVTDVSALAGLTSLTSLSLGHTPVTDVSALAGLTSLNALKLDYTRVTDLSVLASLTSLTGLSLERTRVRDLSALAGLTRLTSLSISGTAVMNISALAGLTSLTNLRLMNSRVTDLSALAGLTNLTDLTLIGMRVADWAPLTNLKRLKYFKTVGAVDIEKLTAVLDRPFVRRGRSIVFTDID